MGDCRLFESRNELTPKLSFRRVLTTDGPYIGGTLVSLPALFRTLLVGLRQQYDVPIKDLRVQTNPVL